MEKVIAIFEDNHGFIGLAADALSAARWIVKSEWLTELDDIYEYNTGTTNIISVIMEKHGYIQLEDFLADFIDSKYHNDYSLPFHFSVETIH